MNLALDHFFAHDRFVSKGRKLEAGKMPQFTEDFDAVRVLAAMAKLPCPLEKSEPSRVTPHHWCHDGIHRHGVVRGEVPPDCT